VHVAVTNHCANRPAFVGQGNSQARVPGKPGLQQGWRDALRLYVSNLTLFLPYAGAQAAIDSAWTLQVKGYTATIPPANAEGVRPFQM